MADHTAADALAAARLLETQSFAGMGGRTHEAAFVIVDEA